MAQGRLDQVPLSKHHTGVRGPGILRALPPSPSAAPSALPGFRHANTYCFQMEASGFFSQVSGRAADSGLLCFMVNMDGQPEWSREGYCWEFPQTAGASQTYTDPLITWGTSLAPSRRT